MKLLLGAVLLAFCWQQPKVVVRAEARGRVLYFHAHSIEEVQRAYGDNLFGCVPERDITWSVVSELPKGEVYTQ